MDRSRAPRLLDVVELISDHRDWLSGTSETLGVLDLPLSAVRVIWRAPPSV